MSQETKHRCSSRCAEVGHEIAESEYRARTESEVYALTVERDNLRKMLEDANQREQVQIEVARNAIRLRYAVWERLQTAAREARETREILYPTQQIPVALAAVDRYNALLERLANEEGIVDESEAERLKKLEAAAEALLDWHRGVPVAWERMHAVAEALDPKPVPMCQIDLLGRKEGTLILKAQIKPDPLEDIMPPVEGSGGTGGCC